MNYLRPEKRRNHLIRVFVGYFLIAIAVIFAVAVLFYLVLGFNYRDGVVIRNGMFFVSSTPQGANITLNGQASGTTNKRLILPAGKYQITLSKAGYRSWQRTVILRGGRVQRYDYPLLIPDSLTSSPVMSVDGNPSIATESPDRNLLLIGEPDDLSKFKLIDLSNPQTPQITSLKLPDNLLSPGTTQSWKMIEWSNDNQHVLLQHNYDNKSEFIVIDTADPSQSINLNTQFGADPTDVRLFNQTYNSYWFYDAARHALERADLSSATITPYLSNVLAFKGYGDSIVLYATAAKDGGVKVFWYQNNTQYLLKSGLKQEPAPDDYLLDLAQFQGDWYAVVGETDGDGVTVYKDPLNFLSNYPNRPVPAYYTLKVSNPDYEEFSANAQFLLAENGTHVAVFNALYRTGYLYNLDQLDAPQTSLDWMDGYHLLRVAHGQLDVADFNNLNQQALVSADPDYLPFFSNNYEYLFTFTTATSSGKTVTSLSQTPLRLPADM